MRGGKLAVTWKRILAYIIDIFIVNSIIVRPLNNLLKFSGNVDMNNLLNFLESLVTFKKLLIITLISGIMTIMYWTVLEYKIQQTLGSLLLNIKVKSEAKKINFLQFLIRNVSKISPAILVLDSIHVLYSDKKQRFSEKWSKTITVENEK